MNVTDRGYHEVAGDSITEPHNIHLSDSTARQFDNFMEQPSYSLASPGSFVELPGLVDECLAVKLYSSAEILLEVTFAETPPSVCVLTVRGPFYVQSGLRSDATATEISLVRAKGTATLSYWFGGGKVAP